MREMDFAGILILKLFEAAARAAVAKAFPFCVGHFLQRLGFPKESCLIRRWFRSCGHKSQKSVGGGDQALLGVAMPMAQAGGLRAGQSPLGSVSPADQNREPDHWFMAPARLDRERVPNDAKAPWVCRNIPARRLDGAQPGA